LGLLSATSWIKKLKSGLSQTRESLTESVYGLFAQHKLDPINYQRLKNALLKTDMGLEATEYLLEIAQKKVTHQLPFPRALSQTLLELISPLEEPLTITHQPFVVMVVGVNGVGKTTSIAKIAGYFRNQGKTVLLGAGDTFRAAAYEQLAKWANLNQVAVVSKPGADSASVCFEAVSLGIAQHKDIILIDTAGRLPTQQHLMDEIRKVKKVIEKALPKAPHEILLVLDANIGSNSLSQMNAFNQALGLTGFMLTKLDGTAKGGIVIALAKRYTIPLRFIGIGETISDIQPFSAKAYVAALLDES
jgi:fused signal recognition particle receptor